jgi:hypothetical protein
MLLMIISDKQDLLGAKKVKSCAFRLMCRNVQLCTDYSLRKVFTGSIMAARMA